ncbi:MAG: hypothetical protein G01um101418_494 [Parcubacteria group bacterium Gr01-1014_18]|nr:MAG: hypothetical protein Greene041636_540 [Parcubacteria group bacterium Greene0416_36]TSC81081.1 MAG: hypothetical protein G01um101418_494 [Parcubacteria group bacterium Gr01-1014_18]TSC98815.1 MAG: hypothetical protein Greene101420_565 [Parcubacteria group bacterium Greene1014_20]TSD06705.1 MAG: hypothetical protein Greene07142_626 [Parcubacteria group bacterium Greene0714_2]
MIYNETTPSVFHHLMANSFFSDLVKNKKGPLILCLPNTMKKGDLVVLEEKVWSEKMPFDNKIKPSRRKIYAEITGIHPQQTGDLNICKFTLKITTTVV